MLAKVIIASGVAVGLAFAVPKIAAVTVAGVALQDAHIPNREQIARANATISSINATAVRDAQAILDGKLNPNKMTMEDCKAGNDTPPCPYVRTILSIAR